MHRARLAALLLSVTLGAALLPAAAAAAPPAAPACDPVRTPPELSGQAPTAEEVIGIPLGERDVTVAESDAYLQAVAAASPRVTAGTAAVSWQGRPLRYAIVGRPGNVTPAGLARIRLQTALLRDPRTPAKLAAHLAKTTPAILWVAGNVHGGEESGTDAALRVLYELADRTDCAAGQILDNAIVVLLPIQNPDGREADTRRNVYGFDLNRDWFARTQPETDGKLQLLRRYPPVLFIDAHEMGRETYFFPPNADPIYHEITDESIDWINSLYGAALAAEFNRQGIPFFNRDVYDLFYMGYGDTVPSTGFTAAGMTFEKASGDPTPRRVYEQYLTQWVSLSWGAANADDILARWHGAWVEAYRQGRAGELEPNEIVNPGNELVTQVPDRPLRHWFLRADDPSKARELRAQVRRLQRMDVKVYRLNRPLDVPDFKAYGRAPRATRLPAGTYWVPMAQTQKHWVQAMLNEDTYTPFPYFYDVTGWSNPLLFNLRGGSSGAVLDPAATRVGSLGDPGRPRPPASPPTVGLLRLDEGTSAIESSGWLRYLLDHVWRLPYRELDAAAIAAGGLDGTEVLLVPNGSEADAADTLGPAGQQALRDWVAGGGRYVGWQGGTRLAAALGITTATLAEPTSDIPGSLLRVRVDQDNPVGEDVGPFAWAFYAYDLVMRASDPAQVAVAFPPAGHPDFFVSGFAAGAEELGGTAAVIDEPVGDGRAVLFSFEPNFRAFTDGTQRLLRNAVLGPAPEVAAPSRAEAAARAAEVAKAKAAAGRLSELERPLRVTVAASGAAETERLLRGYGARYETRRAGGQVRFLVANPRGLTADEHPFATRLAQRLRDQGVPVRAFSLR
ncbi:MAG TPA: M14 family zinc carboxypeptidase [Actinomycetota bacterium]|nr:M14 family zinc carboxypeptidase [Actinomycetota bacterium]